jgi:hypothetical protein
MRRTNDVGHYRIAASDPEHTRSQGVMPNRMTFRHHG